MRSVKAFRAAATSYRHRQMSLAGWWRTRVQSAGPARKPTLAWAMSATLGGFDFGYQLAVISGALLFLRRDFGLGGFEQGVLVSVVPLGAMAGGVVARPVADALGRRRTLILIATLFIAGTALAVAAPGFAVLVIARGLTGLAVGAVWSSAPLYLSEIAAPRTRGRLVTLNLLMITLGIVAAYCVGLAFSASRDWRAMFAVGLAPSALLLVGMLRAPETPAWLESRGETDRAREVLLQVVDDGEAERLLDELRRRQAEERRRLRVGMLLRSSAAPALLIGVTLGALQQLAGINAVIAYAPSVMERTGLSASNSILSSILVGVANVAATTVAIGLVARRGRRPLLLASAAGTFASLALLGVAFDASLGDWGRWLSLAGLLAYVASFAVGLGPIFWLLIAEIFPPQARAAGAGVATAVNWFSSFLVGLVFVPLADGIGQGPTFWLLAAVCALAFVFVRRYVPETKGRTSEDIAAAIRTRFPGAGVERAAR
jgi:SP family galactose:H+ symporter-like MFS transporter